ncbi:hypothetical protein GGR57DRAFT_484010 [Xylariaceae sp. FL1272]|nr:hypothetical protein GGR57DRAFT_484010 [Xylariaceae sp. FL1272]
MILMLWARISVGSRRRYRTLMAITPFSARVHGIPTSGIIHMNTRSVRHLTRCYGAPPGPRGFRRTHFRVSMHYFQSH